MTLFAFLFACSGPVTDTPSSATKPDVHNVEAKAQDEAEALRALGYLDGVEGGDTDKKGTQVFDEARSQPGYNLYSHRRPCKAKLVDARGVEERVWTLPKCDRLMTAELTKEGDVLLVGSDFPPPNVTGHGIQQARDQDRFVARLAWDGSLKWKAQIAAHHDVRVGPNGDLVTLTITAREIPELSSDIIRDDHVTLLTAEGEVKESASLHDLLATYPGYEFIVPRAKRSTANRVDLIHANTAEWIDHPALVGKSPLYAPTNLIVTMRRQDAVAIIDWTTKTALWVWGHDILSAPHGGMVLPNGHVLVFDNGFVRKASRVLEVDPTTNEIVWKWQAPTPTDFFTKSHGYNQRMLNGNTLITYSGNGEAFEVTPAGEIVWDYFGSEYSTRLQSRATINQLKRYPVAMIDAFKRAQTTP